MFGNYRWFILFLHWPIGTIAGVALMSIGKQMLFREPPERLWCGLSGQQDLGSLLGYRVMVAKTGKDAIHIVETFDGEIDLALLDIKLPDTNGRNLYPLIMKARSDLKVIVFSGYSVDGPAREILDAGAQDFIQKPFSIAALSEKLKAVLEGEQPL